MTRTFEHSAYVRAGPDFFLLLWGNGRSPMTVNVIGVKESGGMKVGEECELSSRRVRTGSLEVTVEGARPYRTLLRTRGTLGRPGAGDLVKGVALLKSLYDASPHGPSLVSDPEFRRFASSRLVPAARGSKKLEFDDFLGLVGRGGGFTPAGDDFTAGFTSAFNYIARSRGSSQVVVPRKVASSRTIPESAAVMVYSSRGYVDEEMERLILDSLEGRAFSGHLMTLAPRGHTSGMDMSLGVLLAEAVETGREDGGRALAECLGELGYG